MDLQQTLAQWKEFDDERPSLPGEHLVTAGLGALLLLSALSTSSRLGSTLRAMAGGALLFRAASGRDGLACLLPPPAETAERTETKHSKSEQPATEEIYLGRS